MSTESNCSNISLDIYSRYNNQEMNIYKGFINIHFLEHIFMPIWLVMGIPGAVLSFYIWSIRRQHHSSALYLCILAIDDLLFFLFNTLFYLNSHQFARTIEYPFMCKLFPFINIILQYAAPLITLGFTVERCISICHPFISDRISNYRSTVKTCSCLIVLCIVLAAPKLYFHSYETSDSEQSECKAYYELSTITDEQLIQRLQMIMFYFELVTEIVTFVIVPFTIFFVNIRVIVELISVANRHSLSTPTDMTYSNSPANTTTLLFISFYLLCATIPASVFQLLKFSDAPKKRCILDQDVLDDPEWRRHLRNVSIRVPIDLLAKTYYAAKFYIYIATSQWFRSQLITIFKKRYNHMSSNSRMSCSQHLPSQNSLTFRLLKKPRF